MWQSIFFALNALMLTAFLASAAYWWQLLRPHWRHTPANFVESILPARPQRRPFWSITDLLVMFGSMRIVGQLLTSWMISQGWMQSAPSGDEPNVLTTSDLLAAVAVNSIAGLAGIAAVLAWLRVFVTEPRQRLGLTFCREDAWLGLRAALLILPPVMLVSAAVAYYIPYEHPVLKSLAEIATPKVFLATFVGTALVTPLVEESLVRVLFQGSLQGYADRRGDVGKLWRPQAYWPIFVTSFIFAILHTGQGGAPIPLFLLSLGLGILYRQTGCVTASVVVHMVLNGLTLIVEMVKLQMPPL